MVTTIRNEKKATEKAPRKKRNVRTPEQIVADLEAKIAQVKKRAATKQAKQTDHGKALFTAARSLDKAIEAASDAGQQVMLRACESARAVIGEAMIEMGLRLPEAKRGRPRSEAA